MRIDLLLLWGGLIVAQHTAAWGQAAGSGFSAYATWSSDYVHRGISQTDENAALQVGVDYQHRSGFFAGGWVSNVEYWRAIPRAEPQDIELDYYVGYSWQTRNLSWAATLARYMYPDSSVDYDYTEISGRVGFRDRFFYTLSYTNSLISHPNSALGHELGIEWDLPWSMRLGVAAGRLDSDEVFGGAYNHWNAGISKSFRRFGLDVRYYDTDYDRVSGLGRPLKESWVASLSYQF